MVEELEKQKKLWDRRWDGYYWIGNYYELLCAEIAKAKAVEVVPPVPTIEHREAAPMAPIETPDMVDVKNDFDEDEF